MAISRGYGYNRRSTPFKQVALNGAMGHLLGSSVAVAKQRNAPCYVCDMTAGPGYDPNGSEGSPLILARHISNIISKHNYPVTLVCVDWNHAALEHLQSVLAERYPALTVKYFDAQTTALAHIPTRAVGLTYWDTTRYNDLKTELLAAFGRSHRSMDILITRECLAGYRMQKAAHCAGTLTIQDYLALTGKQRFYIMQYAKHGWWSLGFADNWQKRPVDKLGNFINVDSKEGRRICQKWTADMEPETPEQPGHKQGGLSWE